MLECADDIKAYLSQHFYNYFPHAKIFQQEFKRRFERHRLVKMATIFDQVVTDTKSLDDDHPKLLIKLPNTTHQRNNIFSCLQILKDRTKAVYPDVDFESISVVSQFLDSRREVGTFSLKPRLFGIPDFKNRLFNQTRKLMNATVDNRGSVPARLQGKPLAVYPLQPGQAGVDPDVLDHSFEFDVAMPEPKLVQKNSGTKVSIDSQQINESPAGDVSKAILSRVLTGIRPKTMIRTTKLNPESSGLFENTKVSIPVTKNAKTMSKITNYHTQLTLPIDFGRRVPISLKMSCHPDSIFSDNELKKYFSPAETKTLLNIYRGVKKVLSQAEICKERTELYKRLAEKQASFPAQSIVELIVLSSKAAMELDLNHIGSINSFSKAMQNIFLFQKSLVSNLGSILDNFLDLEEFKIVSAAIARSPQSFVLNKTSSQLSGFNMETYKTASESLALVLDSTFEKFGHVQESLDNLTLDKPNFAQAQSSLLFLAVSPSLTLVYSFSQNTASG